MRIKQERLGNNQQWRHWSHVCATSSFKHRLPTEQVESFFQWKTASAPEKVFDHLKKFKKKGPWSLCLCRNALIDAHAGVGSRSRASRSDTKFKRNSSFFFFFCPNSFVTIEIRSYKCHVAGWHNSLSWVCTDENGNACVEASEGRMHCLIQCSEGIRAQSIMLMMIQLAARQCLCCF